MPNSLLTMTLASNFGTFLLYMLSCVTCIIADQGHAAFNFVKHLLIPVLGLLANLACMVFYLVGPFMGCGTSKEPLLALGVAACRAIYGGIYFMSSSKNRGKTTMIPSRAVA